MPDSDLKRAQRSLAVNDVYVCDVHAYADRDYDPTALLPQPINVQMRVNQAGDAQVIASDADSGATHVVRYFVETGLRILKAAADQNAEEIPQEQILAEVTATFVLRYLWTSKDEPATNLLAAFSENAIHHMWPYWREFLQASTGRLRVPPFVLPMRPGRSQTDAPPKEVATVGAP